MKNRNNGLVKWLLYLVQRSITNWLVALDQGMSQQTCLHGWLQIDLCPSAHEVRPVWGLSSVLVASRLKWTHVQPEQAEELASACRCVGTALISLCLGSVKEV